MTTALTHAIPESKARADNPPNMEFERKTQENTKKRACRRKETNEEPACNLMAKWK